MNRVAIFEVAEDTGLELPVGGMKVFCDPAGIEALHRIAAALRSESYPVTEPKRAKGIEACCVCALGQHCKISLVLGVSGRTARTVKFFLLAKWYPSVLRSLLPGENRPEGVCVRRWEGMLVALERACRKTLDIRRIEWMTLEQAEERWAGTS